MAVSDYSTTPATNTTISGINIAEGCPPSGVNDAIRQMMADIKTFYDSAGMPFSSFAKTLLDDADAAAARATLAALGTAGGTMTGSLIIDTTAPRVSLTRSSGSADGQASFVVFDAAAEVSRLRYLFADDAWDIDGNAIWTAANIASQAELEAASSLTKGVTPGRMVNHPGVAKVVARLGNDGSLSYGYNVASTSKLATGNYRINFGVTFASVTSVVPTYGILGAEAANSNRALEFTSVSTTSLDLLVQNSDGVNVDTAVYVAIFGDI